MAKQGLILAAGMGARLSKYTENLPKGMLVFNGKPLIEWQIGALRRAGVDDIAVVTGYHAEKIAFPGVTYYHNKDFTTTNMLESLMCARERFTADLIVSYADIIYSSALVRKMVQSPHAVSVSVDARWREYWTLRYGTTENDLESLTVREGRIVELGRPVQTSDGIDHRYIGLLKFSAAGLKAVTAVYDRKHAANESWKQSGKAFLQGYMTDLLNETILSGQDVHPVVTDGEWLEFDTNEDYELQTSLYDQGKIDHALFR